MQTICLVACTSKKALYPTIAKDLYRSPLFEGAKNFAEKRCDCWFVISAKHGLLLPDDPMAPYDESLTQVTESERLIWAEKVHSQISQHIKSPSRIIFLAGDKYRSYLQKFFQKDGHITKAPMSELGIGRQVEWLQKLIKEEKRLADIDRFYRLIKRLSDADSEGYCRLGSRGSACVPKRGIYFFFETQESRMTSPFESRVVRIGTHCVSNGSKSTLWNRLRTHRGAENGTGNHRGSIFRLHVGQALIKKDGLESKYPTWGIGQSASLDIRTKEVDIEQRASKIIADMPVLWIEVADEPSPDSDRTYLERNLIALLSGPTGPLDYASSDWLGRWSTREAIVHSGLWNVNHVYEEYDPNALDVLERYVLIAEGSAEPVINSLAPIGWRQNLPKTKIPRQQMRLV